ncbi:hypothetical protein GFY24_32385 [Nocardia sp. SYP-A9097]|uniref:hypothetical protein n=1 Tax=Nocardia sp. SYP-A9097 TaxID=2663237 RepID=UPI00129B5DAB|nr:hypothetical protein [Nocardia sp. SYP-A9097]MRH92084.1 hypothetical protein [Nocardia sp. SYP-A9097]
MNAILDSVQFSDTLGPEEVGRISSALLTEPLWNLHPAEEYQALVEALRSNEELDTLIRTRYSESELRRFLSSIVAELDHRRPWPEPPFRELPVSGWTRFSDADPIARIDLAWPAIQGPVRRMLRKPVGESRYWLLLQLRSGTEIALVWPGWPGESATALLSTDLATPIQDIVGEVVNSTALDPKFISIIDR